MNAERIKKYINDTTCIAKYIFRYENHITLPVERVSEILILPCMGMGGINLPPIQEAEATLPDLYASLNIKVIYMKTRLSDMNL